MLGLRRSSFRPLRRTRTVAQRPASVVVPLAFTPTATPMSTPTTPGPSGEEMKRQVDRFLSGDLGFQQVNKTMETYQTPSELRFVKQLILGEDIHTLVSQEVQETVRRLADCEADEIFDSVMEVMRTGQRVWRGKDPRCPPLRLCDEALVLVAEIALIAGKQYALYDTMLSLEMDVTRPELAKVRYALRKGSEEDRALYEFSSILEPGASATDSMRFVMNNSFKMIRQILLRHIQEVNQVRASRYLELLIARYAVEKSRNDHKTMRMMTVQLYEMIGYVSVRLWNYKSLLTVLQTMKDNGIPLSRNLCTIIMTSLRKKKRYNDALMLLRRLPKLLPNKSEEMHSVVATEMLRFVRERFPRDARIVVAHFLSLYPQSRELLNQLGILGMVYKKKVVRVAPEEEIAVANLDPYYTSESAPSLHILTELYISVFEHMAHTHTATAENIVLLFKRYLYTLQHTVSPPLVKEKLDGHIMALFIRNAITKARKPSTALYILTEHLRVCEPLRWDKQIISYIFLHHSCRAGSEKFMLLTELMSRHNVRPDFNLMAGLALKDSDQGELWYNRLKEMGFAVRLPALREKARAMGWEIDEVEAREEDEMEEFWEEEEEEDNEAVDFVTQLEDSLTSLAGHS